MSVALPPLKHCVASSLHEALERLAEGAIPYAGATELIPAMRMGLLQPEKIVDLKRVEGLSSIEADPSEVHIGAVTRHAELAKNLALRETVPALALAARGIGNPRVRWQGTLGGNLVFAEPRSDLIPVLIALGATARLVSLREERKESLETLVVGPFTFDRLEDELLADVTVSTEALRWQGYERIRTGERPSAGVALVNRNEAWRLVVGSAGIAPVTADTRELSDLDADEVADRIEPLEDSAGSGDYKRHLVATLTRRIVARAAQETSLVVLMPAADVSAPG